MNFIKLTSFLLFLYIGFVPNQTGAMALKPTGLTTVNRGGRLPHYTTSRGQHDYRNTWQGEKENKKWGMPQFSTSFKKYNGWSTAFTFGALGAGAYYWYQDQKEKQEAKLKEKRQKKHALKKIVKEKIKRSDLSFVEDLIEGMKEGIEIAWAKNYYKGLNLINCNHNLSSYEQYHIFLMENIIAITQEGLLDTLLSSHRANVFFFGKHSTQLRDMSQVIQDHFFDLVTINPSCETIPAFLSEKQQFDCILKNLDAIAVHPKRHDIILSFIKPIITIGSEKGDLKTDKSSLDTILETCGLDRRDPAIALAILKQSSCDEKLIQKIMADSFHKNEPLGTLILAHLYKCNQCRIPYKKTTQTEYHLAHMGRKTDRVHFEIDLSRELVYAKQPLLRNLLNSLNDKARELEGNDYITFVHGQRWEYQLAQDLYTYLWQLHAKKSVNDFIFAHIKNPSTITDLSQEEEIHTKSIQNGRDSASRERFLFMNYAFFANSYNLGSSTANFIATNSNINAIKINLKEIFSYFDMDHVYEKYQKEIAQLKKDHKKLTDYGNCLLIAAPKTTVEKSVFVAEPGGSKHEKIISSALRNLKGQKNILETCISVLKNDDYDIDHIEFCLPMTNSRYGGLNPESGIKIFSFNAVPQDKWKDYCAKRDALFDRIKADVEKEQKQ